MGGFGIILASRVFVKVVEPGSPKSELVLRFKSNRITSQRKDIRKTAMRRNPFQKTQSDFQELLGGRRLQAFIFQVL